MNEVPVYLEKLAIDWIGNGHRLRTVEQWYYTGVSAHITAWRTISYYDLIKW